MPWIDADDWLAYIERKRGPTLPGEPRPLTFEGAAELARLTGRHFQHQSDGTTMILVSQGDYDPAC